MQEKINKIFVFFVAFLFFLSPAFLFSQERSNIAVIPMKNLSGMPEYTTLCETVTETVTSVIRFLPDYSLYEATDNPELLKLDITNLESLKNFSTKFSYDEILFGNLRRNEEGKLLFRLQIYDLAEHDIIVEQQAIAETLLDVFDTADIMTLDLLGQITDVNIGFGTIELIKTDGTGTYEVYLNDKKIRNPKKNFDKVLNGEYLIEIHQDRVLGDTVIYSSRIYVNEFQTTTVRFSIPEATEEELRFIIVKNGELLETASDPDNLDQFLTEIAEFQELTKDIDYDPELVKLKDTIIEELGARAAFLLEEVMEQADETYYSEDPDFETANQTYARISGLVNANYSYSSIETPGGTRFQLPRRVKYSEEGILYLLDGEDTPRLSSFGPDAVYLASRELKDWDTAPETMSFGTDNEGNCYVFGSGTATVLRYVPELEAPVRLTIPDYAADPEEELFVAVSRENAVYLIGGNYSVVFEFSIGNEISVERDNVIEETLRNTLETYGNTPLGDVFFDENNTLHLFFPSRGQVVHLTSLGELISTVEFPDISTDSDIALDGMGYYYFTMPEEDRIVKYSPKGELVSAFGEEGDKEDEFNRPLGIAVNGEGTVYIADSLNNRLQVLTLAAPPLLLPEVAQYGESFKRREKSAKEAVKQIERVQIDKNLMTSTLKFTVPAAIIAGSVGLRYLDGILYRNSMNNYADYQTATNTEEIKNFRTRASVNWVFSRVSLYTGYAAMGAGAYWLGTSITEAIDSKIQKKRTVEYLQSFDMDKDYGVDEQRFRSLLRSRIIGFTTGVLPPLVGGTTLFVLSMVPSVNPEISHMIAMGTVLVPPIFSHIYAGQISWGSFVTGIIADLLAVTAALTARDEHQKLYFDSFEDPRERGQRYSDNIIQDYFSNFYMLGALALRFAAGLHDFTKGWVRTNEYNRFEAIIERPSPLSMQLTPYFGPGGAPGLALTLQM